jgi:hypothetical protein
MSLAFSPTRYVISIRRKAKRERLLLPAMDDTIGQLDHRNSVRPFKGIIFHRHCQAVRLQRVLERTALKMPQYRPTNLTTGLKVIVHVQRA